MYEESSGFTYERVISLGKMHLLYENRMIFELGKNGKSKKNGDPEYEQYHDEFYRVVFKDINDFIAGKRQKAGGKNHD